MAQSSSNVSVPADRAPARFQSGGRATPSRLVPELTLSSGIKLNARVSLRCHREALSLRHRAISPNARTHPWQSRQANILRVAALFSVLRVEHADRLQRAHGSHFRAPIDRQNKYFKRRVAIPWRTGRRAIVHRRRHHQPRCRHPRSGHSAPSFDVRANVR